MSLLAYEPVELSLQHLPDDVFEDTVPEVSLFLDAQVVASARGGNFNGQLGRAFDVSLFADPRPTSVFRLDEERAIGLRHIL